MSKKIKYLIFISLIFVIGTNPVLASSFSTDKVIDICGFNQVPEKIPEITSKLYNVVKILTPVVLIVMGIIDFTNNVMGSDDQKMKKNTKKFITRLLAAIMVFFVLSIVQFIFNKVDSGDSNNFTSCMNCLLNNNNCGASTSNKTSSSNNNNSTIENPISKILDSAFNSTINFTKAVLEQKGITECGYCGEKGTNGEKLICYEKCGCNHYTSENDCNTQTGTTCEWKNSACVLASSANKKTSKNDSSSDSSSSSSNDSLVTYLKKYLKHPYVWSGTTLCEDWSNNSSCGVDCSGFVYAVFGKLGYDQNCIGRSTYKQVANLNAKKYEGTDNLKVGDLIFFHPGDSHVGIYIGNGEYIHASTASTGIIVSKVSNSDPQKWARVDDVCPKS